MGWAVLLFVLLISGLLGVVWFTGGFGWCLCLLVLGCRWVCFDLLFGCAVCYLVLTAWCFGFVLVLFCWFV